MNFFFSILLLLIGCSTPKTQRSNLPNQTTCPPTNIQIVFYDDQFAYNTNLILKANIKVSFPNINQSVSSTIEIAKMDSLLLSLNAIFGISVGKLFATPTEFIMNNNMENTTYLGSPTSENIKKIAFIELNFKDLISILKTIPTQERTRYYYNKDNHSLEYEDNSIKEILILKGTDTLSQIIRKDLSGKEIFNAQFTKHTKKGKYMFANNIKIDFPQQKGNIIITFSDIKEGELDNIKLTSPMRLTQPKSYKLEKINN